MHALAPYIDLIKAAILGVVEGLTEFLPVSSTGHLLLMEHFLGWGDDSFGKSFAILIQLGAILALLSIYFGRICRWRRICSANGRRRVSSSACWWLSCPRRCLARWPVLTSKRISSTCASSASCSFSAASCCCGSTA